VPVVHAGARVQAAQQGGPCRVGRHQRPDDVGDLLLGVHVLGQYRLDREDTGHLSIVTQEPVTRAASTPHG
jgi:hypothetical protein